MRKPVALPLFLLGFILFSWVNLPKSLVDRMRLSVIKPFSIEKVPNQIAQLQLENQNLKAQIEYVYDLILFDKRVKELFDSSDEIYDFSKKRSKLLRENLKSKLYSVPAQVIYRDPNSWSSSLWVNVGENDNAALGKVIVSKNSPVLSEGALVGVVDFVGKNQSRIRLITDSGLSPAVRVCRGGAQNREISHQLASLLTHLEKREDLFSSEKEQRDFLSQISLLQKKTGLTWDDGYLAKGEIHGSSAPFWRSRGQTLQGIGFNFDYPDRDDSMQKISPEVPIIKQGDLLITSGLDGVFPQGLSVGTVSTVFPLKPGKHAYDIEVKPVVSNLNDLQTLMVLPPIE